MPDVNVDEFEIVDDDFVIVEKEKDDTEQSSSNKSDEESDKWSEDKSQSWSEDQSDNWSDDTSDTWSEDEFERHMREGRTWEVGTIRRPESFERRGRGVVEMSLMGLLALEGYDFNDRSDDFTSFLNEAPIHSIWNTVNGRRIRRLLPERSRTAETWVFSCKGEWTTVEQYYSERYGVQLQYPELYLLKSSEFEAFPLEILNVLVNLN